MAVEALEAAAPGAHVREHSVGRAEHQVVREREPGAAGSRQVVGPRQFAGTTAARGRRADVRC